MKNTNFGKNSQKIVAQNCDIMKNLRDNIEKYMTINGATLHDIADKANLSIDTLRTILYGHSHDCKISTAVSIAKALGISIDELFDCGTFSTITEESISICRTLPENSVYLVRWFIRHQQKINAENPQNARYINVGRLEEYNGNLRLSNDFCMMDISNIPDDVKHKVFIGIQLDCDRYMPIYSPFDRLLVANDRIANANENSVIICAGNVYIVKRKVVNGVAGYYSIRDGKFRLYENEVDEIVGYIAYIIR